MAIPVVFLTMVVRKADLQNCHPNWLVWFQEHYPSHYQDEYLVGQCSMSSGEVQGMVDLLLAYGIPENRIAVVDIIHGILEPNEWLEVGQSEGRSMCWLRGNAPMDAGQWPDFFDGVFAELGASLRSEN